MKHAVVWLVYLQILVISFRRQRRSEILIYLGGNGKVSQRVLISNLGFEAIYVLEILLTVKLSRESQTASVIDRTDIDNSEPQSLSDVTLQGPLESGKFVDIGNFDELLLRAGLDDEAIAEMESATVTVAAITSAASSIVAARREFGIKDGNYMRILLRNLYASQIRSWWGRRKIRKQLEKSLTA